MYKLKTMAWFVALPLFLASACGDETGDAGATGATPSSEAADTTSAAPNTAATTTTTTTTVAPAASPEDVSVWPSGRGYHQMAYDIESEVAIVVGGCHGEECVPINDARALDPEAGNRLPPASSRALSSFTRCAIAMPPGALSYSEEATSLSGATSCGSMTRPPTSGLNGATEAAGCRRVDSYRLLLAAR